MRTEDIINYWTSELTSGIIQEMKSNTSFKEYFHNKMMDSVLYYTTVFRLPQFYPFEPSRFIRILSDDILKSVIKDWKEPLAYHDKTLLKTIDESSYKFSTKLQLSSIYGTFGK